MAKTTAEKIEIMKAYEEGKKIECAYKGDDNWFDGYSLQWNWEIYDYRVKEEPPKQRMTNIQLMEWLSKGNGVYKNQGGYVHSSYVEQVELLDEEVDKTILIRPFGQTEWIEPTVDIYERDCKNE